MSRYVIIIESSLFEGIIMEKSMRAFDEIINFFYIKYTKEASLWNILYH